MQIEANAWLSATLRRLFTTSGAPVNKPSEAMPTPDSTTGPNSEHTRTHRRWAVAVLALYGIVLSIGMVATLVHRSWVEDARLPAMQLKAEAPIR